MLKSILLLVLGASLGVSSFAFRQDAMAVLKVADPTSEDSCVPKQGIKTLLDVAFNMLGCGTDALLDYFANDDDEICMDDAMGTLDMLNFAPPEHVIPLVTGVFGDCVKELVFGLVDEDEDSCITPTEVVTLAKEFEWIIPEPVPYDLVECGLGIILDNMLGKAELCQDTFTEDLLSMVERFPEVADDLQTAIFENCPMDF